MKQLAIIAAIGLGTISLAFTPILKKESLTIKPAASTLEWHAEKITGSHAGTIALKNGSVEVADGKLTGGNFVIDMSTIVVTDMDGDMKSKLEGHLNSPDFFDTGKFSEANLKISNVKYTAATAEGYNTEISGTLTIKGISQSFSFPAKVEITDGKFAAFGVLKIDRTNYNIKYGSASFFDSLGDKAIYDDFTVKVSIGASR